MKRNWLKAAILGLMACASLAQAAGSVTTRSTGASMEIGLRIVEACAIHMTGGASAQVACDHDSPYLIQATAAASGSQAGAPAVLTVSF